MGISNILRTRCPYIAILFLLKLGKVSGAIWGLNNGAVTKTSNQNWDKVMTYAGGNWSGTIANYDVSVNIDASHRNGDETDGGESMQQGTSFKLVPRMDNNKKNMRVSAQPRQSNPNIVDWKVRNARSQGSQDDITFERDNYPTKEENKNETRFRLVFDCGLISRVIFRSSILYLEHSFWDVDDGIRRTVILCYDPKDGCLQNICYLLLKKNKSNDDNFLSVTERRDCSVMPKKSSISFEQLENSWNWNDGMEQQYEQELEMYHADKNKFTVSKPHTVQSSVLDAFFCKNEFEEKDSQNLCRLILPNGVTLICPWSIKSIEGGQEKKMQKSFDILMGFKKAEKIQTIQFAFDNRVKIKEVTARQLKSITSK